MKTAGLSPLIALLSIATLAGLSEGAAASRMSGLDRETGFIGPRGAFLSYELFRPPGHAAAGPLPLVIHLHGFNEGLSTNRNRRYSIFEDLAYATQHRNFDRYGFSPGCNGCPRPTPEEQELLDLAAEQNDAYSAYLLTPFIQNGGGWNGDRLAVAREAIDYAVSNYAIDTDRIYLSGFSSGGFGAIGMLAGYPDLFAAGVSLAGGGFPSDALVDSLVEQPLWMFHGAADGAVPVSASSDLADALTAAGGNPRLTLIPGGGHDASWQTAYADRQQEFYPWLFSQRRRIPEPGAAALLAAALGLVQAGRQRLHRPSRVAEP